MRKSGVKQHDNRDCGAACVATIFRYYGFNIPLIKIREKMKVDKNGSSLYAISRCVEEFHFIADVLEGSFAELEEEISNGSITLPIIVHCLEEGFGHYIVLKSIIKDKIKIFNPARGECLISVEEFKSMWTGYLVTIKKDNKFKKYNSTKGFYLKYWKILWDSKNILFLILILSFLLSGIMMITSLAYQKIIDYFILGNQPYIVDYDGTSETIRVLVSQLNMVISNFHLFFMALVIIFSLQMFLSISKGIIIAKISIKINKELINKYLYSVIKLPMNYFKDRETGEILSRFSDIEEIKSLISEGAVTIIINFFMVIVGGTILISINLFLFFMAIAILLIYTIIVLIFKKPISSTKINIFEANSRLISKLKEVIDNICTIKNCSVENNFIIKLKGLSDHALKHIYKGEVIYESQIALLNNVENIGAICILWYGSYLVLKNKISLGDLIAFESLLRFFLSPFQQLISMQISLQGAFIAMDRLNDILEVDTEEQLYTGEKKIKLKGKNIIFENITFGYNYDDIILENINVTFESGKKYALVGKSGCGKSTLMKLLLLHYQCQDGSIRIGKDKIQDISLKHLRKKIKYVSADSKLFEGSIIENVLLESTKTESDPIVKKIINGCGLEEILNTLPNGIYSRISEGGTELSSGQRQRIILAQALLAEPEVLVLDEATSHLDEDSENRVFQFILDYEKDITCICVLHNSKLVNFCDKIVVMEQGKIVKVDKIRKI